MNPIDPESTAPVAADAKPVWEASSLGIAEQSDAADPDTLAERPVPVEAASGTPPRPAAAANGLHKRRTGSTPALLAVAALVAVGGVGFAIGHVTSSGSGSSSSGNGSFPGNVAPNASGNPGFADGRGFGGLTSLTGTVVSVGSDSITVKLSDGSTVALSTSASTTYHAQTNSTSAQVAAGQTVQVQTTGGDFQPGANASASPLTTRTATDVTIVSN